MATRTLRPRKRTGPYTFDDFCRMIREDEKADLLNGVIYMASPENTDANRLYGWLFMIIGFFLEARDLGEIFGSRVALHLNDHNGPEPDIAVVLKESQRVVRRGHILGPCDLAMEIVSPESVERDYVDKRDIYQKARAPEYWIIDEEKQKVTLLRLDRKGEYREIRPRHGELHSAVLKGFWLRPEWLWQNPRPKKAEVLNEILGRQS